jgi:hypothetical protein
MIKFFRHIRKSLLMENKTSKYFKYAIGEIVLVVIGILIALQINNWNNARINTNLELNYIKNIERDLKRQLDAIQVQMDFESDIAKKCDIALSSFVENNKLKVDSTFAKALGLIIGRRTFLNPNPAYKELISSGNIALIKNQGFKDKLINYYLELERIEKIISNNNTLYTDQIFTPVALINGVTDQRDTWDKLFSNYERKYRPNNILTNANREILIAKSSEILKNPEKELSMINHISSRKTFAMVHVFFLLEFKARTTKLLEEIKEY